MKDYLKWKNIDKRHLITAGPFSLNEIEREAPDGKRGIFVTLDSKDWVVVIPVKRRRDGELVFIMVDQYRHGSGTVTREFPAGLVEKNETFLEAAKRELREETGCIGKLSEISTYSPNPAFMSNRQAFFLAEELEEEGELILDEDERIERVEVPVEEIIKNMGSSPYDNGGMLASLAFYLRLCEKRPELRR